MYGEVTRSQTKAVGTQMPKVHEADKVVDPALKPESQARKEGIPKLTSVIPKSMSQPQRIIPPVLPRNIKERSGTRRIVRPKLQSLPQPQPSPAPPPIVPYGSEPPSTAIPPLGERLPQGQSRYRLPVCTNLIFLLLPPKPPDIPIDTITPQY